MTWSIIDWFGAGLMAACGICGVVAYGGGRGRVRPFWLLAGLGFGFLAVDELWSIHERIGRELDEAGVPRLPGINHHDDLVLLAYGLAGLALCAWHWRQIVVDGILAPFALGFVALAAAIVIDSAAPVSGTWPHIEEPIETAGAAFFLVGFGRRAWGSLGMAGASWPHAEAISSGEGSR